MSEVKQQQIQNQSQRPRSNRSRQQQQNTNNNNNNVTPIISVVPTVNEDDMKVWLVSLYDVSQVTSEDIISFYELYSYKGFNRAEVLKQLRAVAPDVRLATHIIVAVALRGPQAASTLKLPNNKTPLEMGLPASGGQGTKALTLNKIQAATADIAAYYLKKMRVPKRLNVDCPAWLQFPSAGSIQLPAELRNQHREFAIKFSEIIGGVFQPQIYMQMETNAYLDASLRLFE